MEVPRYVDGGRSISSFSRRARIVRSPGKSCTRISSFRRTASILVSTGMTSPLRMSIRRRFLHRQPTCRTVNFDTTELVSPGATGTVKVPTDNSIQKYLGYAWIRARLELAHGANGHWVRDLQPGFVVQHYVKSNIEVDDLTTAEEVLAEPALQTTSITTSADTINYLNTGGGANFSGDQPFPSQTIGVDIDDHVIEATAEADIPSTGQWFRRQQ